MGNPIVEVEAAVRIMADREAVYKQGYNRIGSIMFALFPDGVELKTPEDFARMQNLMFIVSKLNRYAQNMPAGGHKDSITDVINYAAILASQTGDKNGS